MANERPLAFRRSTIPHLNRVGADVRVAVVAVPLGLAGAVAVVVDNGGALVDFVVAVVVDVVGRLCGGRAASGVSVVSR